MEIVIVLVFILLVVAVIVAASRSSSVVTVNDQVELPLDLATVERDAFGPLGAVRGASMSQSLPGQVTLTTSFIPTWAVLLGILAFPIGLLLLFLIRRELTLHVRYVEQGGGTLVQVAGKTRKNVALAVGEIFGSMPATGRR